MWGLKHILKKPGGEKYREKTAYKEKSSHGQKTNTGKGG